MKIINRLKTIKNKIDKNQNINFGLVKTVLEKTVNSLYEKNIIDDIGYKMIMDKMNQNLTNVPLKTSNIKNASIKNNAIVMLIIAIVVALANKSVAANNYNNQRTITKQNVSQEQMMSKALAIIIYFEKIQFGDVYDKNGNLIQRNVAVVYDDDVSAKSSQKRWNGRPQDLDRFIRNCKGTPTIGYGTTDPSVVRKGFITQQQAKNLCKKYMRQVHRVIIQRLGKQYWDTLNENQQAALISYFYNCGANATATKLFAAIRIQDWKQAARQMDIVKSKGKILKGLQRRRAIQQKIFLQGL